MAEHPRSRSVASFRRRDMEVPHIRSGRRKSAKEPRTTSNPFKIPDAQTIFEMRNEDTKQRQLDRTRNSELSIFDKTKRQKRSVKYHPEEEPESEEAVMKRKQDEDKREVIAKASASIRHRHGIEKENLADYVKTKREMFLVKYSLSVKREEMDKLTDEVGKRQAYVSAQEKLLAAEEFKFRNFLRETSQNASKKSKAAGLKYDERQKKMGELEKLRRRVLEVNKVIDGLDRNIQQYMTYKEFFDSIFTKGDVTGAGGRFLSSMADDDDDAGFDIHFSEPEQLLHVFKQMEEMNLDLITNDQETTESINMQNSRATKSMQAMQEEIAALEGQISAVVRGVKREEEKINVLKARASFFATTGRGASKGSGKPKDDTDPQTILPPLREKIVSVFTNILPDDVPPKDTLEVLARVEATLEALFADAMVLDAVVVRKAIQKMEKARKDEGRQLKFAMIKEGQKQRRNDQLVRAQNDPNKKVGKPLMRRSNPFPQRKKEEQDTVQRDEMDDIERYFFS